MKLRVLKTPTRVPRANEFCERLISRHHAGDGESEGGYAERR
jgi:hypothetical protein